MATMDGSRLEQHLGQRRGSILRPLAVVVGACLVLAVAVGPCLADTVFSDGTSNLANYTQTVFTSNTAAANATYSVTQSGASGNPAPSLDLHIEWTVNTTFTIFDGLINSNFTYNPATAGAISAINFSQDRNITFTDSIVTVTNTSATALLEQNSKFYLDTITGAAFVAGTWQTTSATGLTANNFSSYDFSTNTLDSTQHPDFSTAGSVIGFGFRTGLGRLNTSGTGSFDSLADNLSFTVTPVPEPSSLLLLCSGLAGLGYLGRKRLSRPGRR